MDLLIAVSVSDIQYFTEHWKSPAKAKCQPFCWVLIQDKSRIVSLMDKKVDRKKVEFAGGIFRRLVWKQVDGDVSSDNRQAACNSEASGSAKHVDASLDGMSYSNMGNVDGSMNSGEYVRDHSALLSLQPWIFRTEGCQSDEGNMRGNGDSNGITDAWQSEFSPRSVKLSYGFGRSRSSGRSRKSRRCAVKPLTAVENCLIPQLYNQQFEIREYEFSSVPSSSAPTVRPLIITDGNRIISKSANDPMGIPFESGLHKEVGGVGSGLIEAVVGVPPLSGLKIRRQKSKEMQLGKLESHDSQRSHNISYPQGSVEGMLLFFLGINVGIISTIISNRKEIDKLNGMLKHTENLVQDLQEELEMKESLTVKELENEASECQELNGNFDNMEESINSLETQVPASHFPEQERLIYDLNLPKAIENSESMSKIEAELEAELERLELNMNATSLEGRMSALSELDPDLVADVVQGDLRVDMLNGGAREGHADDNRGSSSISTTQTHNANYAVSPTELSLRLHEVIQFRLEERIKELERALQNSQKQLQVMEAEQVLSQRAFSTSDMGSSNQESPTTAERDSTFAQPLCLNLAGDALHAYDEAYEEFMKIADTENLPSSINTSKKLYEDGPYQSDQSILWGMEGSSEGKSSLDNKCFAIEQSWGQMLESRGSDGAVKSDEQDGECDSEDEEGKKLIQQIVERTRQGSPVVIHAQRMLFSMDD